MSNTIACPKCASEVPVCPGFPSWCEECGWGGGSRAPAARDLFDRIYRRIGHKTGERLFLELKNDEEKIRKPGMTPALIAAYLLAIPAHLATLGLLAAGVWLLIVDWFNLLLAVIGIALIGAAYALRPRFGHPPVRCLSRTDAPVLHGLVDDVARSLDTDTIDEISIEPELNAAYGRHGIRRKGFLVIGAPLWLSLDRAEKVALIAHELAHQVNGDVTRGFWIGTAVDAVQNWYEFLRQPYPEDADLAALMAHYLCLVLSLPVHLFLSALIHLNWNASQRAEYLADYLGSRVSGTPAFIALHERMSVLADHPFDLYDKTKLHAYAPERIIPEFVAKFATIPPREVERARRISKGELLSLDATHPPTHYRCRLLEAYPCPPGLLLSDEQADALNAEIAALDKAMGNALIDRYLPDL